MKYGNSIQKAALIALAVAWGFSTSLVQAESTWTNPDGGNFLDAGNWDTPAVPGASNLARIGVDGGVNEEYTITLTANHEIAELWHSRGEPSNVTLNLGGNTLTANNRQRSLYVVSAAEHDRSLTLINGTMDLKHSFTIGSTSTAATTLSLLTVKDATLHARTDTDGTTSGTHRRIIIGGDAPGELRIEDGGQVLVHQSQNGGNIAHLLGEESDGKIVVTGSGLLAFNATTATSSANYLNLSDSGGNGTLEITKGGTVEGISLTRIGRSPVSQGGMGIVRVDGVDEDTGRASSFHTTTLRMSFLTSGDRTDSLLEISNGGNVRVTSTSNDAELGSNSTLDINGGEMTVAAGINWWAGATYKLTLHDKNATPLSVGDDVTLQDNDINLVLALSGDFDGEIGDVFTVLDYDGQNVIGFFKDKADGWIWEAPGDREFKLHYNFNNEDRIALELIPEPHTMGLILLGLGAVALRRRRLKQ